MTVATKAGIDSPRPFAPVMVAVVDIGSPAKGRLGWHVCPDDIHGSEVGLLIEYLAAGLLRGPCALGFEAPMYVPFRDSLPDLMKARPGEGNRAWCAGAGAGSLATALAVVPYILRCLRAKVPTATATLDWMNPPAQPGELFLFEAFVSGDGRGGSHVDDAKIAAECFYAANADLNGASKLDPEPPFCLLGAAMLRTGWSDDFSVLSQNVLVVGPTNQKKPA